MRLSVYLYVSQSNLLCRNGYVFIGPVSFPRNGDLRYKTGSQHFDNQPYTYIYIYIFIYVHTHIYICIFGAVLLDPDCVEWIGQNRVTFACGKAESFR